MSLSSQQYPGGRVAQAGAFLAVSTLALTTSILGGVALATGTTTGLEARLPFYVLTMAATFVGAIVVFEGAFRDGIQILQYAVVGAIGTLVLVSLSGEGVAFVVQHPSRIVSSQLLVYFLAAALVGTGLGYWSIYHWQDVTGSRRNL